MTGLTSSQVRAFREEGYLLLPGVFTEEEMTSAREAIREMSRNPSLFRQVSQARHFHGSLLNYPALERFVFDDRVLGPVKAVLGDSPVFFGDTSVQTGRGGREFHRDSVNRVNLLGPDWEGDYPLVRVGIYMGDFTRESGGLKVVPRSHRPRLEALRRPLGRFLGRNVRVFTPAFTWIRRLLATVEGGTFVPSRTGDLILWNFRLLHTGNAVRLKRAPSVSLPCWVEDLAPASWALEGGDERAVMFLAFAGAGPHLDRYLAVRRRTDLESWKASRWDAEVEAKARAKGLVPMKPDPAFGSGWSAR
jgi:ectoine hydroxylase-related dioxygenase (phytanoyl-CoA dioxygenase family)